MAARRGRIFGTDQVALALSVHEDKIPTEFLPAYCNWMCEFHLPIFDQKNNNIDQLVGIVFNAYGNYILLHYEGGDNYKRNECDSWLKLSGLVIRHMIVRLQEKPDVVKDFGDEKLENTPEKKSEELAEGKEENKEQLEKENVEEDKEVE